jgi:hypothetical protein
LPLVFGLGSLVFGHGMLVFSLRALSLFRHFHLFTLSLFHSFTFSLFHLFTLSPFHSFAFSHGDRSRFPDWNRFPDWSRKHPCLRTFLPNALFSAQTLPSSLSPHPGFSLPWADGVVRSARSYP